MRLYLPAAALLLCALHCSAFSLASIFGGGTEIITADGVDPHFPVEPLDVTVDSHILKPIKHKLIVKPIKKKIKKKVTKKIKKKIKKIKKKKIAFFAHLAKPFLSLYKSKKEFADKLSKIKPTKTEYVEVTKKVIVHPVCYITLNKKKPCLKLHEKQPESAYGTSAEEQSLEVEQNMGEIDQGYNYWPWTARSAKEIESDETDNSTISANENTFEEHPVDTFDGQRVYDVQAAGKDGELTRITYTVNAQEDLDEDEPEAKEIEQEEEEGDQEAEEVSADSEEVESTREKRYIDIIQPSAPEVEEEEEYALESSEDEEDDDERFLAYSTKTVLVTRVERYTNSKVTATVIAKNCAPVTPYVPKCKKKKVTHAVIRERPDLDLPLVIESTPVLSAVPPVVKFEAKEIINDSEVGESAPTEVAVEAPSVPGEIKEKN